MLETVASKQPEWHRTRSTASASSSDASSSGAETSTRRRATFVAGCHRQTAKTASTATRCTSSPVGRAASPRRRCWPAPHVTLGSGVWAAGIPPRVHARGGAATTPAPAPAVGARALSPRTCAAGPHQNLVCGRRHAEQMMLQERGTSTSTPAFCSLPTATQAKTWERDTQRAQRARHRGCAVDHRLTSLRACPRLRFGATGAKARQRPFEGEMSRCALDRAVHAAPRSRAPSVHLCCASAVRTCIPLFISFA